jgi:hypothetical protein
MTAADFLTLACMREKDPDRAAALAELLRETWNAAIDRAAEVLPRSKFPTLEERIEVVRSLKVAP